MLTSGLAAFIHTGDGGGVERVEVHLLGDAVVDDLDLVDRFLGELTHEGTEMLGKFQPRAHDPGLLGGDGGHVERVRHGPGQQVVRHLLGHLKGDVFLRLGGGGAQMRGHHDIGQTEERVLGGRFLREHVEGRARDMAGLDQFGQRRLVDQPAARAVDDPARPSWSWRGSPADRIFAVFSV